MYIPHPSSSSSKSPRVANHTIRCASTWEYVSYKSQQNIWTIMFQSAPFPDRTHDPLMTMF